jgi:hypothetical protein
MLQELAAQAAEWLARERNGSSASTSTQDSNVEGSTLEALGLKALLFVLYTMQGKAWPSGGCVVDFTSAHCVNVAPPPPTTDLPSR